MTKPAARETTHVQPGPAAPPAPADTAPEAPPTAGMSWGWRVALFLWASAFLCLLAYELLNTLVRSLARLF